MRRGYTLPLIGVSELETRYKEWRRRQGQTEASLHNYWNLSEFLCKIIEALFGRMIKSVENTEEFICAPGRTKQLVHRQ